MLDWKNIICTTNKDKAMEREKIDETCVRLKYAYYYLKI